MPSFPVSSLRKLIAFDALTRAAMGCALLVAAGPISAVTAIPSGFLFYAGLTLVPIAVFMAAVASQPVPPPGPAAVVIVGNVLWVAASFLLLLSGWTAPNPLGVAVVTGQALVVAALAKLEFDAWRPGYRQPING